MPVKMKSLSDVGCVTHLATTVICQPPSGGSVREGPEGNTVHFHPSVTRLTWWGLEYSVLLLSGPGLIAVSGIFLLLVTEYRVWPAALMGSNCDYGDCLQVCVRNSQADCHTHALYAEVVDALP